MDLVKLLMGPLDKSYCSVFLILGLVMFFMLVSKIIMLFIVAISPMNSKNEKYKGPVIFAGIIATLIVLLYYLVFRVLYNICNKVI